MFAIKAILLVISGILSMICYLLGGSVLFVLGMFAMGCICMLIGDISERKKQ